MSLQRYSDNSCFVNIAEFVFFISFAIWIIFLNYINGVCICWNSYTFVKYPDSHWDLLGCFHLFCVRTDFRIYFIIFFLFLLSLIANHFKFWILQYFYHEDYYLFLLFFCAEIFHYQFCFYFYRFGWSVISCNHKTTKLFGGVCVCVWLILSTHVFLYGIFVNFLFFTKQVKLVEGCWFSGIWHSKLLSHFWFRQLFSLTL